MASIGGINVSVGFDTSRIQNGIAEAEGLLDNFQKGVTRIGLGGLVKGDPFSKTKEFIKTARVAIDGVFDNWTQAANKGIVGLNRAEVKIHGTVKRLIKDFEQLNKVGTEKSNIVGVLLSRMRDTLGAKKVEGDKNTGGGSLEGVREKINEIGKLTAEQTKALIDFYTASEKIGTEGGEAKVRDAINRVEAVFGKEAAEYNKKVIEFGNKIKAAYRKVAEAPTGARFGERKISEDPGLKTEYEEKIRLSKRGDEAYARQRRSVEELRIAENKLVQDMRISKDVATTSIKLTKVQTQLRKQRQKVVLDDVTAWRKMVAVAGQENTERQADKIKSLIVARKELVGVISKGNVSMVNLNKLEAIQVKLNKDGALSAKKLSEERKKVIEKGLRVTPRSGLDREVYESELKVTGEYNQAMSRKRDIIRSLRKEETKLNADIKAGIFVKEKAVQLDKVQTRLRELGITTFKKEIKVRMAIAKVAAAEKTRQRALELHKLMKERRALRIEMEKGGKTTAGINKLEKLNNQLVKAKGFDLRKAKAEVKSFRKELDKREARKGFLSPAWFRQRAGWFIQLRGFWAIYRGITEGFRKVTELEQAMANLQAVTQSADGELLAMDASLKKVAKSLNIDITTIASGMVKLGQAGLEASEVSNAIKDVAMLATATMTDMETAADLVTTVMKAWSEESANTEHIVDVLASTVNRSKVQIKGLGTALQYLTGVAPQVGLSLQQTAGIIGMMANQGIKMSKVGTGLRSLLGELVKPSKRFGVELHKVGLTLRDVAIVGNHKSSLVTVLERLKSAGFDAASAFKGLDRRAASAVAALISKASGLRGFIDSLGMLGTAATMAATQMESLQSKATQLKNTMIILADAIYDEYSPMMKLFLDSINAGATHLEGMSKSAKMVLKILTWIGSTIGLLFVGKTLKSFTTTKKVLMNIGVAARFAWTWLKKLSILNWVIIALTSAIIPLINYFAKAKYGLAGMSEELAKTNAKIVEEEAILKSGEQMIEKYTAAMKKSNKVEAEQLIAKNALLHVMHLEGKSINEIKKKYEELIEVRKKDLDQTKQMSAELKVAIIEKEIAQANRELKAAEEEISDAKRLVGIYKNALVAAKKESEISPNEVAVRAAKSALDKWEAELEESEAKKGNAILALNAAGLRAKLAAKEILTTIDTTIEGGIERLFKALAPVMKAYEEATGKTMLGFVKNIIDSTEATEELGTMLDEVEAKFLTLGEQKVIHREVFADYRKLHPEFDKFLKEYPKQNKVLLDLLDKEGLKLFDKLAKIGASLKKSSKHFAADAKAWLEDSGWEVTAENLEIVEKIASSIKTSAPFDIIGKALKDIKDPNKWLESYSKWLRKVQTDTENFGKTTSKVEKKIADDRRMFADARAKEEWKTKKPEIDKEEIKRTRSILEQTREKMSTEAMSRELEIKSLTTRDKFVARQAKADKDRVMSLKKLNDEHGKLLGGSAEYNRILLAVYEKHIAISDRIKLDEKIYNIEIAAQEEILKLTNEISDVKIDTPGDKERILDLEEQRLQRQKAMYESILATNTAFEGTKLTGGELLKVWKDLDKVSEGIKIKHEEIKKDANALYRVYKSVEQKVADWRNNFIDMAENEVISGLTEAFNSITRGFEEQKEEANSLKGELAELEQQYKEAIADGQAEEASLISSEISRLKGEINDLEDPIKNLGEVFKDFFLNLAKAVQNAINEWIAMQIVMGITKVAGSIGGAVSGGFGSSSVISSTFSTGSVSNLPIRAARGGILPSIKAFRSFSRGGITGNPTLALLGDNASQKELVIPSENINKDSVSGYARDKDDKQPINIVNVLTKDDIAGAMAGKSGERVIINTIGADLNKRGPIYRALRA